MDAQDFREICDLAEKRDEKTYAWLRYLILLGAGALTVLVSLHTSKSYSGLVATLLKVAWGSLGAGVVFGSFTLYGEVWAARDLAKRVGEYLQSRTPEQKQQGQTQPIVSSKPKLLGLCEKLCYLSFLLAVIAIVAFAVLET